MNRQPNTPLLRYNMECDDEDLQQPNNKLCHICGSGNGAARLIVCDACNKVFHATCLNLPMFPVGKWLCPKCRNENANKYQLAARHSVYLYERVSTKNQNEPEFGRVGLDTQNNILLKFALDKGLIIKDTIREVGSAYKGKQELLPRLIRKLRKDDCIMVYSVSRFCRNITNGRSMLSQISDKGAYVYSVTEDVYSNDDRFLLLLKAAEDESTNIGIKVRDSIARIRQQGGHIGPAPFGRMITRTETGLRISISNPDEIETYNKIIDKIPTKEFMEELNNSQTLNRGRLWTMRVLRKIYVSVHGPIPKKPRQPKPDKMRISRTKYNEPLRKFTKSLTEILDEDMGATQARPRRNVKRIPRSTMPSSPIPIEDGGKRKERELVNEDNIGEVKRKKITNDSEEDNDIDEDDDIEEDDNDSDDEPSRMPITPDNFPLILQSPPRPLPLMIQPKREIRKPIRMEEDKSVNKKNSKQNKNSNLDKMEESEQDNINTGKMEED